MPILEIHDLHTYYGNIHALKGISLSVEQAEIVTLIGGNGAGKSTTLKTITGLLRPRQGSVVFEGEDLGQYKAHEIVFKGVAMVPEGRGIFARLTTAENLDMGAYHRKDKAGADRDGRQRQELARERHGQARLPGHRLSRTARAIPLRPARPSTALRA